MAYSIKFASFSVMFIAATIAALRAASGALGLQTRLWVRRAGPFVQSGYCKAVLSFEAPKSSNNRELKECILFKFRRRFQSEFSNSKLLTPIDQM